jgi:hypothetical protein
VKNGVFFQSQEIATEGELRIQSVDDSDRVRELQDKVADLQAEVMRLESFKRRIIAGGGRLPSERSSSIDSTDDDTKIRLDDPSLRLNIVESPTSKSELNFSELCHNPSLKSDGKTELDPNMNTHTTLDAHDEKCASKV